MVFKYRILKLCLRLVPTIYNIASSLLVLQCFDTTVYPDQYSVRYKTTDSKNKFTSKKVTTLYVCVYFLNS